MMEFSNCDELLKFMVDRYDDPYIGYIEFQGDPADLWGMSPLIADDTICVVSTRYEGTAFLISSSEYDKSLILAIVRGRVLLDETYCAILPNYIKEELIAACM